MTIREDFQRKRQQEKELILLDIQQCARDYKDNDCDPQIRVRAAEKYCMEKEKCMSRDPEMVVTTTRLTASLTAEILNEFVEPLEYKTIGFFFFFLFG